MIAIKFFIHSSISLPCILPTAEQVIASAKLTSRRATLRDATSPTTASSLRTSSRTVVQGRTTLTTGTVPAVEQAVPSSVASQALCSASVLPTAAMSSTHLLLLKSIPHPIRRWGMHIVSLGPKFRITNHAVVTPFSHALYKRVLEPEVRRLSVFLARL